MAYQTITPPEAKALLDSDAGWQYLDVRTVAEFERGHPEGAYNVPVANPGGDGRMQPNPEFVETVVAAFPAETPLVLGCAVGGRSALACELLEEAGFAQLANMHGGFSGARDPFGNVDQAGWHDLGLPTSTAAPAERTYEHLQRRKT